MIYRYIYIYMYHIHTIMCICMYTYIYIYQSVSCGRPSYEEDTCTPSLMMRYGRFISYLRCPYLNTEIEIKNKDLTEKKTRK